MNYNTQLSPRDVQEIAGHADIKTTYRYVHASQDRINNNAKVSSPVNSFLINLTIPVYYSILIIS